MKTRLILAWVLFVSSAFSPLAPSRTTSGALAHGQASPITSSDAPADWLAAVQNDIQEAEYTVSWQDKLRADSAS